MDQLSLVGIKICTTQCLANKGLNSRLKIPEVISATEPQYCIGGNKKMMILFR